MRSLGSRRAEHDSFLPLQRKSSSRFQRTINFGSVIFCTSAGVTPGATSRSTRPSGVTAMTASSVTIRSTTSKPVSGSVHFFRIFWLAVLRGVLHGDDHAAASRQPDPSRRPCPSAFCRGSPSWRGCLSHPLAARPARSCPRARRESFQTNRSWKNNSSRESP